MTALRTVSAICLCLCLDMVVAQGQSERSPNLRLGIQIGHAGAKVTSVVFDPDGRLATTAGRDGIHIWDVATGHEISKSAPTEICGTTIGFDYRTGVPNLIFSVLAISKDGRLAALANRDRLIGVFSAADNREVTNFRHEPKSDSSQDDDVPSITALSFSPDGRRLLGGLSDGNVRIWDVSNGKELRRLKVADKPDADEVKALMFAPDGRSIAIANGDVARVVDAATGRELGRFIGHRDDIASLAFSPNGKLLLTGSADNTARLWEVANGQQLRVLGEHKGPVNAVAFSQDGRLGATTSDDGTAKVWDAVSGQALHTFDLRTDEAASSHHPKSQGDTKGLAVTFSPDAKTLLTGSDDGMPRLWDLSSQQKERYLVGESGGTVSGVEVSNDRRWLSFTTGDDNPEYLWDIARGVEVKRADSVSLPADKSEADLDDISALPWSTPTPTQRLHLTAHIERIALAPNGQSAVVSWTSQMPKSERQVSGAQQNSTSATSPVTVYAIWDLTSGRELFEFKRQTPIEFSPNGRYLLVNPEIVVAADRASGKHEFELWDTMTGSKVRTLKGHTDVVNSGLFSPNGEFVVTASDDRTVRLWDVASGREVRRFQYEATVEMAAVAPQGRSITAYIKPSSPCSPRFLSVRDIETGRQNARLDLSLANDRQLTGDWSLLTLGLQDGTVQFVDFWTGAVLATAISFKSGGWAVVDPAGRYDASDPENSPGLYWLLGDEVIELKQLKERFFTPGLLARVLGFNNEPLPAVTGLDHLQLWPKAELVVPRPGSTTATVKLTNRGGGIGNLVVKVNGREITVRARGTGFDPNAKAVEIPVDLSPAELRADGNNQIEVMAFDGANLVSGRGFQTEWQRAPEKPANPPTLHAIVAGVSSFENSRLNLTFPAKDAEDMAKALQVGGAHLFGVEHVDVQVFASGTANEPTKQNLSAAFEKVATHAGPNDVALVYFAGHGVTGARGSDAYYFLTREARSVDPDADTQLRAATTISSAELLEWLRRKGMPLRQVVVLDTCAAGQAATELVKLADRRELTADQRRAIELLKDRTGSHILMGAAADKVSYEASRYGQGLLTYALLSGMRGEALDEGGRLDVRRWFDTAERRVPELAQGIGGIQQPVVSSPGGQSFPIALITKDDFPQIPLAHIKPQLLRAVCLDNDDMDSLQLCPALRAALRAEAMPLARGPAAQEPPLVYLDEVAGDVADAFIPQVRYSHQGDKVQMRLRLISGDKRKELNIEAGGDIAALARTAAEQFVKMTEDTNH